ncbi:MAG TPA: hypothetical protein VD999_07165 [Vitreimonas sp.]|nr:hypothetical protein [Vitreimonas sp.]
MYADTVYLFGDQFAPAAGMLGYKETLPNGTKVDQKRLAELVVIAALVEMSEQGYIKTYVKDGEFLFFKTQTAVVSLEKKPAKSLGVFEHALLSVLDSAQKELSINDLLHYLLQRDSYNPWGEVTRFINENLINRGILEKTKDKQILFIKTYKNVLKGEIPQEEQQRLEKVKTALEHFKNNDPVLYKKVLDGVNNGISSRVVQSDND